jgi:hypothetical protein
VKLFRKAKSKFYWYDFTVRGRRHRGSTQETKPDRASKVAGLKLAQVVEGAGQLPKKPGTLAEFSERFLAWVTDARLESQNEKVLPQWLALVKATAVVNTRLDEIRNDCVESLKFHGSPANSSPRSQPKIKASIATFERLMQPPKTC